MSIHVFVGLHYVRSSCLNLLTVILKLVLSFLCVSVQDEELAPPTGPVDHMFYSTVSSLDRKPSLSSDEDGDIYRHTPPPAGCGGDVLNHLTNQTDKTTDAQVDQDAQDRDTHKPDQLAESWMGYSGPGCGILSLQVTDR